jgi:hypothetical protein
MSHIPDKLVFGRIEYIMKRNGEFYHTQTGTKMPSENRHHIDDVLPKVLADQMKVGFGNLFQVGGKLDRGQMGPCAYLHEAIFN